MVYARGLPHDFDDWRDGGASGWGSADVARAYAEIEGRIGPDGATTSDGPLGVSDVGAEFHPLKRHFFAAAAELGLPRTDDFNGDAPEGVGEYRITTRNGFRCSAADAFLRPALRRPNVKLETNAFVTRLLFDGARVSGVEFWRGGETFAIAARREVIVCGRRGRLAAALASLGDRPRRASQSLGVEVKLDAPAVGGFLQDHLAATYTFKARERTLNDDLRSPLGLLRAGLTYLASRKGPVEPQRQSMRRLCARARRQRGARLPALFQSLELHVGRSVAPAKGDHRSLLRLHSFAAADASKQPRPHRRGFARHPRRPAHRAQFALDAEGCR